MRLAVRLGDIGADGDAARVGVLDDRDARRGEVVRRPQGGIGVDVVVVGHLLAVQLLGLREPAQDGTGWRTTRRADAGSRRSAAPRPAVVDRAEEGREPRDCRCRIGGVDVREPGRDSHVVRRRVRVRRAGQRAPLFKGEPTGGDRVGDARIVRRIDDDSDGRVVLRRGAHHRRAADVDLLDHVVLARAGLDRRAERVEVDDEQVERLDAELAELRDVVGRRRSASSPAWMAGCSVFTRPSRHSGKPVTSLTGTTGTPASRSFAAVEPVDTISTPAAASARPRSTSPVLSETETRARRIGRRCAVTSPGPSAVTAGPPSFPRSGSRRAPAARRSRRAARARRP